MCLKNQIVLKQLSFKISIPVFHDLNSFCSDVSKFTDVLNRCQTTTETHEKVVLGPEEKKRKKEKRG